MQLNLLNEIQKMVKKILLLNYGIKKVNDFKNYKALYI